MKGYARYEKGNAFKKLGCQRGVRLEREKRENWGNLLGMAQVFNREEQSSRRKWRMIERKGVDVSYAEGPRFRKQTKTESSKKGVSKCDLKSKIYKWNRARRKGQAVPSVEKVD